MKALPARRINEPVWLKDELVVFVLSKKNVLKIYLGRFKTSQPG